MLGLGWLNIRVRCLRFRYLSQLIKTSDCHQTEIYDEHKRHYSESDCPRPVVMIAVQAERVVVIRTLSAFAFAGRQFRIAGLLHPS